MLMWCPPPPGSMQCSVSVSTKQCSPEDLHPSDMHLGFHGDDAWRPELCTLCVCITEAPVFLFSCWQFQKQKITRSPRSPPGLRAGPRAGRTQYMWAGLLFVQCPHIPLRQSPPCARRSGTRDTQACERGGSAWWNKRTFVLHVADSLTVRAARGEPMGGGHVRRLGIKPEHLNT